MKTHGALGWVWFYLVTMPLFAVGHALRWVLIGGFESLFGRGYKARNDLVDAVYKDCVDRPADQGVRLPWVNSGEPLTEVLNGSGRLYAYIAVANGWFGLAEKISGQSRKYRYYYRRDLTGNWFAEIWSIWRSGFWAAFLALPYYKWATQVASGREMAGNDHYGLILLVSGLLLMLFFMPRAVLGRGTHLASISLVNGSGFGSYGCAQVINWVAGLAGVSYVWMAFGLDWNLSASLGFLGNKVSSVFLACFDLSGGRTISSVLFDAGGFLVALPAFGMAVVIIPAAFFWFASLRFLALRNAKAQLLALPYSNLQKELFDGSNFDEVSSMAAPQIALGGLLYALAVYGLVLFPVTASVIRFVFG